MWAPSAPEGAPEVCGVLVQCSSAGAVSCGVQRSTAIGGCPTGQAVATSSSSTRRARAGSMCTPGPMEVDTVTDNM
jgi:hypothetical protein